MSGLFWPSRGPRSGRTRPGGIRGCLFAALVAAPVACPGLASAAPGPLDPVGPAWTSARGRARVRGDRPINAPVAGVWSAGRSDPAWGDRQALAAFERATFPDGVSTLVRTPPESWMKTLIMPDLPVRWNGKTVEYLKFFRESSRGQSMMRAWMRRAGRYEKLIRDILREVGVPPDLMMVALAESGFNPRVRSRVGAGGLWQFMEGTGQVYGLARDYWVDERFDPIKSTYAAAAYLQDLKTRFGSWELALAAYNAGYGLIMTSIDRHNTNNFWTLTKIESGLPHSTTNYIPKIIAATIVGRNRNAFGCAPADVEPLLPAAWTEVTVSHSTALADVAELLDAEERYLFEVNAQLIRRRTPPRVSYALRIPRNRKDRWPAALRALEKKWAAERVVTVREGEKLEAVAARHKTTGKILRQLNGIADAAELRAGVSIVVPAGKIAAGGDAPPLLLAAVPPVEPGPGQMLLFYQVTRASTPASISRSFGVSWERLAAWNDLDPRARLQNGQVLQVVVPAGFSPDANRIVVYAIHDVEYVIRGTREHVEASLRRRGLRRRGLKVRAGDTLERIGRKYGLTVGDLARINGFSIAHIPAAGDILVVYVSKSKLPGTTDAPAPPPVYGHLPVGDEPAPQTRVRTKPRKTPSTASTSRRPGKQ